MILDERVLELYECRRSLDEDLLNGKVLLYSWGGSNIGFRSVALQRGTSRNTVSRISYGVRKNFDLDVSLKP